MPARRAVDRARQVDPAGRLADHPLLLGARVEEQAGVDEVARAPQGQAAVAAPGRERGAVEAHRRGRHERGVEVDGVGVGRRSGRAPARAARGRRRSRDRAGSSAACPSPGPTPSRRTSHLGRAVVAQHAVRRHLLPEVVLVDELDREPEAVVPRVVVGGVTGEDGAGRACAPGGGGAACGRPSGRSRGRRPRRASSVCSTGTLSFTAASLRAAGSSGARGSSTSRPVRADA